MSMRVVMLEVLLLVGAAVSPGHARVLPVHVPVFPAHAEPVADAAVLTSFAPRTTVRDTLWADSILYRFELPGEVFTFGDTVRLVYRITNQRSSRVTLSFPTTCHEWFAIYPDSCGPGDEGCEDLWSSNTLCFDSETTLDIEPGDSVQFTLDWRQHALEGYRVPAGTYTAYGTLYNQQFEQLLLSIPFTIIPYGPQPIQEALDAAGAGDTVLVGPGVYAENLVLLPRHAGITLRSSDGPEATILDGGRRGSVIYAYGTPTHTAIEGFTIQGGRNADTGEFYLVDTPAGGVTLLESGSPVIRNNIIRDNECTSGGGIAVNRVSGVRIEGCLFLDNFASELGGGIFAHPPLFQGSGPYILHCTFVGNEASEGGGICAAPGVYSRVSGCIFYRNHAVVDGGGLHCPGYNNPGNRCNDFWENTPDDFVDCTNTTNPFFADPLFCAPEVDDYRLQGLSPCAPLMNPTCGQVGAYGVGCATEAVGSDVSSDPARLGVTPNPARGAVRLLVPAAWRSAGANVLRIIEIRTVTGRRIWSAPLWPGAVVWDGTDASGREAPSGIYLVDVREGERIRGSATLVRVR